MRELQISSSYLHEHSAAHRPAHPPLASEIELSIIRRSHLNVLLVGPRDSNERALSELLPACRTPVCEPNPEFDMPIAAEGTFVLRRIEWLSLHRQRVLHDWLSRECGRIQVVSLASPRLFQLVSTGAFHEALFYRLNVVMLTTTGN
jgi:hypothetical protein